MKLIISPAKKMNQDLESPLVPKSPLFLDQTTQLLHTLQAMEPEALGKLWKCNPQLTALNVDRLAHMDLHTQTTPAVFSYEGIQYRYMAPHVLETAQLQYLQDHLRIVSGFYGLLAPDHGVTPYRLEMQAKLALDGHKTLYGFWGDRLAQHLCQECDAIVNLASQEYSRAIAPHLPTTMPFVTCVFAQRKGTALVETGTLCKMARGEMVRWLSENQVTTLEGLCHFNRLDFCHSPADSTPTHLIFIKGV